MRNGKGLSSCDLSELRRGHGIVLTEEAAEGGTVGNAALLNDESDRVVGRGEQAGTSSILSSCLPTMASAITTNPPMPSLKPVLLVGC